MAFNFLSKKILVTGAGRGLGRQIVLKLVDSGADVFALGRTASNLEKLKEMCPKITTITVDLSDWKETKSVLKQLDPMDGLVNNAGLTPDKYYSAIETDIETLQRFANTDLYGAITCIQTVAEKMISEGNPGSIVNVSALTSLGAYRGLFPYNVSKAALDLVTKQFALELATHNIRVNSINPTLFFSESAKELLSEEDEEGFDELVYRTPLKRLPEPDELVGPVLYLLSDHSSMVTGTIQVIDGGNASSLSS